MTKKYFAYYNKNENENRFQFTVRGRIMSKNYNTRQKKGVDLLIEALGDDHFTVEELCEQARKSGVSIGVTTVYRHLDKLVKEGRLYKYTSKQGESACYQSVCGCGEHFHLRCVRCGRLDHLECEDLKHIRDHVSSQHGFEIDPSQTVFYGVCKECAR